MILISGTSRGFGKYLFEKLPNTISFDRKNPNKYHREEFDIIIHCAFNNSNNIRTSTAFSYLEDNIFLTEKLTKIKHKKFIFISSIDVYPLGLKEWKEDEDILIDEVKSLYGKMKIFCEAIVKNNCKDYLILRPSAMIGKYMRPNSLIRILEEEKPQLTLAEKSTFNYIFYKDVLRFIEISISKSVSGIFNISSKKNISLEEVAKTLNKKVNFGNFNYVTNNINIEKFLKIIGDFNCVSLENLEYVLVNKSEL